MFSGLEPKIQTINLKETAREKKMNKDKLIR